MLNLPVGSWLFYACTQSYRYVYTETCRLVHRIGYTCWLHRGYDHPLVGTPHQQPMSRREDRILECLFSRIARLLPHPCVCVYQLMFDVTHPHAHA